MDDGSLDNFLVDIKLGSRNPQEVFSFLQRNSTATKTVGCGCFRGPGKGEREGNLWFLRVLGSASFPCFARGALAALARGIATMAGSWTTFFLLESPLSTQSLDRGTMAGSWTTFFLLESPLSTQSLDRGCLASGAIVNRVNGPFVGWCMGHV